MTDPDPRRVEERSDLLAEEEAAGSDDPKRQAAAILEDSDERARRAVSDRDDREEFETRSSDENVERPPAQNPQAREHRGSQDVGRGDESPLDEHDEATTEYAAGDAEPSGRD